MIAFDPAGGMLEIPRELGRAGRHQEWDGLPDAVTADGKPLSVAGAGDEEQVAHRMPARALSAAVLAAVDKLPGYDHSVGSGAIARRMRWTAELNLPCRMAVELSLTKTATGALGGAARARAVPYPELRMT